MSLIEEVKPSTWREPPSLGRIAWRGRGWAQAAGRPVGTGAVAQWRPPHNGFLGNGQTGPVEASGFSLHPQLRQAAMRGMRSQYAMPARGWPTVATAARGNVRGSASFFRPSHWSNIMYHMNKLKNLKRMEELAPAA